MCQLAELRKCIVQVLIYSSKLKRKMKLVYNTKTNFWNMRCQLKPTCYSYLSLTNFAELHNIIQTLDFNIKDRCNIIHP